MTFTVTEDGRLQALNLTVPFVIGKTCTYTPQEDIPIVNNKFEYSEEIPDDDKLVDTIGTTIVISFTGTFETETTLSASYSVVACGREVGFRVGPGPDYEFLGPIEGTWAASWQGP